MIIADMTQSKLDKFMHDKTSLVLMVILAFVIGVTIGQLVFHIDFAQIAKNAHGLTKDEAAKQYSERQQAMIKLESVVIEPFTPKFNVISIQLSNTCLALIKHNDTKTCPDYRILSQFDTTNQKKIGKFVDTKGYFHRDKSRINNPSMYFNNNDTFTVCVDCPNDIFKSSQQIFITHEDFKYTKDTDNVIVNNTRYEYINKAVDRCQIAMISYNKILVLDTIEFMKSGCGVTTFDEKVTIKKPYTQFDISTTKAYKYAKWLTEAKKLSGTNCLKSTKC